MSYRKLFKTFLESTNEKQVLCNRIKQIISERGIESMLDIGPGDGNLSIPLSETTEEYLGIEKNKNFVSQLRSKGVNVIHESFPVQLDRTFDLVLISHSMPYAKRDYQKFLQEAFRHVREGGVLVLITFRGEEDTDWKDILKVFDQKKDSFRDHKMWIRQLHLFLSSLGKTSAEHLRTSVSADTVDKLFNALGFVFSNGKKEQVHTWKQNKSEIKDYLSKHYKNGEEYAVSCTHTLFIVYK